MNDNLYPSAVSDAKQSAETVTEQLGLNIKLLTWDRLFAAVISLIVCVIAIHLIMRVLRRVVDRSRLSEALGRFLLRLCRIALDFVTILIVAGSLGFDVTALLAVFSLLGLALTLSIQNSLSNLMSGIVILVTKPFTVGEYIESGGVAGTVRDIGLFYTQMTTLDNKAIYVPNSELSATKIINYTREPNRRVDLIFSAGCDYPTETVLAALRRMVQTIPGALTDPAPEVHVENYAASNIEYVVRVWCKHEDYWNVYYAVKEAVPAAFAEAGVQMSYEHMNVHMV